ncbi:MAG: hypothetical protein U5K54_26035 [Cytophagales bacterium]|nr:hypothetical protein [Cytophagales bacterium]
MDWKIRAAFGKAGIQPQPFDRYPTLSTRTLGNTSSLYYGPNQSNPNLGVEVSTEKEFGTDISFNGLSGKWLKSTTFSFTYWTRGTENAIWRIDARPSSGVGRILDNAFSLSSDGIQASLNIDVYSGSNFRWNSLINWSKQSSQIDEIKGGAQVVITSSAGSTNYVLKEGDKIGQIYGFKILRSLDQASPVTGQPYIAAADRIALYSGQ